MLFKLVPLLLSSLFFSYVAGIPVHGSNLATAGAGASGVSAGGADSGWRDMFEKNSVEGPLKKDTFYIMLGYLRYVAIAPTAERVGVYISIEPTAVARARILPDTVLVDLKDVENAELRTYSAIMKQEFIVMEPHSRMKIMKQKIAVQASPLIMTEFGKLPKFDLKAEKQKLERQELKRQEAERKKEAERKESERQEDKKEDEEIQKAIDRVHETHFERIKNELLELSRKHRSSSSPTPK